MFMSCVHRVRALRMVSSPPSHAHSFVRPRPSFCLYMCGPARKFLCSATCVLCELRQRISVVAVFLLILRDRVCSACSYLDLRLAARGAPALRCISNESRARTAMARSSFAPRQTAAAAAPESRVESGGGGSRVLSPSLPVPGRLPGRSLGWARCVRGFQPSLSHRSFRKAGGLSPMPYPQPCFRYCCQWHLHYHPFLLLRGLR